MFIFAAMTLETSHDLTATAVSTADTSAHQNSMLKSLQEVGVSDMSANISHDQEGGTNEDEACDMTENISHDQDGVTNEDRANDMSENMSHDQEHVTNNSSAVVSQGDEEVESFIKNDDSNNDQASPDNTKSLLTRLKQDLPFRRRYMHTMCVCWGFIVLVMYFLDPLKKTLKGVYDSNFEVTHFCYSVWMHHLFSAIFTEGGGGGGGGGGGQGGGSIFCDIVCFSWINIPFCGSKFFPLIADSIKKRTNKKWQKVCSFTY